MQLSLNSQRWGPGLATYVGVPTPQFLHGNHSHTPALKSQTLDGTCAGVAEEMPGQQHCCLAHARSVPCTTLALAAFEKKQPLAHLHIHASTRRAARRKGVQGRLPCCRTADAPRKKGRLIRGQGGVSHGVSESNCSASAGAAEKGGEGGRGAQEAARTPHRTAHLATFGTY